MKGMGLDESMSNLASTISNETSISSSNNVKYASSLATNNDNDNDNDTDTTMVYAQQASSSSFAPQPHQSQTSAKKKRSLPGNPDPDAEVIALSPKSLLATNRFICEVCNKGFQRDQNLQLHRRGHNLPWKLKQRANKDVIIKKVYVCPESTCVHHDPSRALGDLTGIKKHFCRKHGEKKWNCEKCSKKYAVQSDWKAHSKICGTREYRCDCGTLFSRRDSFITHRAFCDALAQESAISINPVSTTTTLSSLTHHHTLLHSFPMKREQEDQHASNNMDSIIMRQDVPLWLACPPPLSQQPHHFGSGLSTSPARGNHQAQLSTFQAQYNSNQNHSHHHQDASTLNAGPTLSSFQLVLPSHRHMSATALLQRAAQMGVTISNPQQYHNQQQQRQQQQYDNGHITNDNNTQMADELPSSSTVSRGDEHHYQAIVPSSSMLLHDNVNNMIMDNSMQTTPASSMFDPSNSGEFHHQTTPQTKSKYKGGGAGSSGGSGCGGGNEGMTRDFLGLRTFSHKDFLNMAALGQMKSSSSTSLHHQQQNKQNQIPW